MCIAMQATPSQGDDSDPKRSDEDETQPALGTEEEEQNTLVG